MDGPEITVEVAFSWGLGFMGLRVWRVGVLSEGLDLGCKFSS